MRATRHASIREDETGSDHAIACFLRANPDWLAGHPELYQCLTPPIRVHGDVLADHMAAMVAKERRHAAAVTTQMGAVLAAGRAGAQMLSRVHAAVLALMTADTVQDWCAVELPRILALDAVCLCCGVDDAAGAEQRERLERLLGHRDVVFRTDPADAVALYGEAAPLARHDVLIRLPALGVMALACRDPLGRHVQSAHGALRFLGQATAAALTRRA